MFLVRKGTLHEYIYLEHGGALIIAAFVSSLVLNRGDGPDAATTVKGFRHESLAPGHHNRIIGEWESGRLACA
ncbi:hypothetical protein [Actinomadura graeca]|uniref:hypothetical protein n=1 Tax=Actinomadura graeca TaxID=2750812 RepID=UPI001E3BF53E|nr:hypothetical protein [Actinomadura graeca]